jgi:hypothetical protein
MAELSDNDLCHLYMWLHGNTPQCGCYAADSADELVIDVCDLIAAKAPWTVIRDQIGGSDGAVHIVMSVITDAGLIAHRTSITSSWITARGEWVRHAYRELGSRVLNVWEFPHEGEPCSADCMLGRLSTLY